MSDVVTFSWGADEASWSIVIHGGAGAVPMEARARHVEGCKLAAIAGAAILRGGGSALDAAQRAVELLEDDPVFNAGTGAALNTSGEIELDAALMDGSLRAGAVCALPPFVSPIKIARAVLDEGVHVLYAAAGAEAFAKEHGFVRTTTEAMTSAAARAQFVTMKQSGKGSEGWAGGTVGAVARDSSGHVAAATSTGGTFMKQPGRVVDAPLLGAGTYADDEAGACSNTGHGESVMKLCMSKTAIEWLRQDMHPEDAARAAVAVLARRANGSGGIILVDRRGRLGLARTTDTMSFAAMSNQHAEPICGS